MSWREMILDRFPSPHDREPRELRREILDELEDHLQCAMNRERRRTDDEDAARRAVLARFGNPGRLARRLWLDAMKGELMYQRIMIGANAFFILTTLALAVTVVFMMRSTQQMQVALLDRLDGLTVIAAPEDVVLAAMNGSENRRSGAAVPQEELPDRAAPDEEWAERLGGLTDNWREAFAAGNQLVTLPPEEGFRILQENWDRIRHVEARQQVIKAFAFTAMRTMHPHIIDVMHLGMEDESPEVQSWAMGYLRWIAFEDFARDFSAYERWRERHRGKTDPEVIIASMHDWAARLRQRDAEALALLHEHNFLALRDQPFMHEAARASALPEVLADIVQAGAAAGASDAERELATGALRRIREFQPDEAYLRRVIVPIITDPARTGLEGEAYGVLQGSRNAWARDLLLEQLVASVRSRDRMTRTSISTIARVLASYQDPTLIPTMIRLIELDNTRETIYGIGYFGLHPLTGVSYDESHDGAWWRDWWARNRSRFPEPARDMEIPELAVAEQPPAIDQPRQSNGADWPRLTAGDDPQMEYFLIGGDNEGDSPEGGFRLLLVLPGGDGSADFHPFVSRMREHALGGSWLIAQLIAPVWDEQASAQIVWPVHGMELPRMRFTTESFVDAVVEDVKARRPVNEGHIYALGWSSGGPAVYAATARQDTPLRGAFVAMSVFRPGHMPPMKRLEGRRFYLLHSPQDFIAMRFPNEARDTLRAAGATVHLETYEGGHGWHGDVFAMIERGVLWLESED